jgi:hypothetical protein
MPDPMLRPGSRGASVIELQDLLNARLTPSPRLVPDGIFGGLTAAAVRRLQNANWLNADGIVGNCTWSVLRGTESFVLLHPVRLVAQPTATTCWAASAAMILGRSAPVTAPPFMLNASGALINDSELNDAAISSQFCRAFGLRLYPGQSWLPQGLAAVMRRGPVMCNVLWDVTGFVSGAGSDSHWVVFAGIRGDGTPEGTTIRVYDPLPQGRGSVYPVIYGPLMRRLPAATYQLFQH